MGMTGESLLNKIDRDGKELLFPGKLTAIKVSKGGLDDFNLSSGMICAVNQAEILALYGGIDLSSSTLIETA